MNKIATIETLERVYHSNADLLLSEFSEIVDAAGYRLTGHWDAARACPEIIPIEREQRRAA